MASFVTQLIRDTTELHSTNEEIFEKQKERSAYKAIESEIFIFPSPTTFSVSSNADEERGKPTKMKIKNRSS